MEIVTLYKISFDTMENNSSEAINKRKLGVFGPKDGLTAHGNCGKFIEDMKPTTHYLGWNGEIYPKFIIEKNHVR